MRKKVTVVGAGNVGASTALATMSSSSAAAASPHLSRHSRRSETWPAVGSGDRAPTPFSATSPPALTAFTLPPGCADR